MKSHVNVIAAVFMNIITAASIICLFPRATLLNDLSYTCAQGTPSRDHFGKHWKAKLGKAYKFRVVGSGESLEMTNECRTQERRLADSHSFVMDNDLLGKSDNLTTMPTTLT